ncbi:MAG: DEAD/DEAH box helicase, partial [Gordonia sp. (in: high G+C Gram-positive bacteria)]
VEDTARLRDALGVPAPMGVPAAFLAEVADPVGDLVHRYARTHGPFTVAAAAAHLGLGPAVVRDTLARLAGERIVVEGDFLPETSPAPETFPSASRERSTQWCHAEVLGALRRGSLAAGRAEIEPVDAATLARFTLAWQHVDPGERLTGVDGVAVVLDQLAGYPLPASAWESLILPARVSDYRPAMLDELLAAGEIVWSGAGRIGAADGWIRFCPSDLADVLLPAADAIDVTEVHRVLLERFTAAGGLRFAHLAAAFDDAGTAPSPPPPTEIEAAIWDLVWSGHLSNDTFAPVRALIAPRRSASSRSVPSRSVPSHRSRGRAPRLRPARLSTRHLIAGTPAAPAPPTASGRWFTLGARLDDPTVATSVRCDQLLARHGVVTRGAVGTENVPGGFARIYKALSVFEDSGQARRGYYVDGLGGAQFAATTTVDELRRHTADPDGTRAPGNAVLLAATDPANPFGAALAWPDRPDAGGHRPGRKPGALVVLVDGDLALFVERGGKSVLTFTAAAAKLGAAATALADAVAAGGVSRLTIDQIDGVTALRSDLAPLLVEAGFATTPRGLRSHHGHHARG